MPDLGVGMVYWPALAPLVGAVAGGIDVLEVEPQPFWFAPRLTPDRYRVDPRALDHLRALPHPKIVHGVGFPVGGTVVPRSHHLGPFAECISDLEAVWASEHLSFNRTRSSTGEIDMGFLLPPVQTQAGVALAASNIETVKAHVSVPFAFETGVSYLRPAVGELSDGQFFASVAEAADCGILLDLHNIWANERNGRQPVLELVDELPLERVWELHLAGGQDLDGMWVDAHSGLAPREVLDLARHVVPRLPNLKAIILEIMPEYAIDSGLSPEDLLDQLGELREIWDSRSTSPVPQRRTAVLAAQRHAADLPTPLAWEHALAGALAGEPSAGLGEWLRSDPGVAVLRRLIGSVRAGKIATALRLTTRLLLLQLGERGVRDLLERFWQAVPSEPIAANEARRFAAYVEEHSLHLVPYIEGVMAFELAAHEALAEGRTVVLHLEFDVRPIIAALREGRLPDDVASGKHIVSVEPPNAVMPESDGDVEPGSPYAVMADERLSSRPVA